MPESIVLLIVAMLRAALAAVLVTAGAAKLADTPDFASTLIGLGIGVQNGHLLKGLSLAVPFAELGMGLAVAGGWWAAAVNLAVLTLLCGFTLIAA